MKQYSATLFLLLIAVSSLAQPSHQPQVHIPKTPEVSMMEKFIENPVDLSTGLHDLTVPIYNLSFKDFNIPISLKYHSSGMKVDELASNIGLGWSLNLEGAVSATVAGIPDTEGDWPNAYYSKIKNGGFGTYHGTFSVAASTYETTEDPLDLYNLPEYGSDIQFLRGALKGIRDSEPDIFFFSFPGGGAGKFFIDENGNFQTIPHQKVTIEKVSTAGNLIGYKITDMRGIVYQFLDKEESYTTSSNSCGTIAGDPITLAQPTFRLTSITTPHGSEVNFHYTSYNYSVDNQNSYSRMGPGGGPDIACMNTFIPNVTIPCVNFSSTNFVGAKRLDSLTTNHGGKIVLHYSINNRLDLPEVKRMIGVSVFEKYASSTYQLIKSFQFNNSTYFQATATSSIQKLNYRLKLSSVREVGKPPYVFEYEEASIPHRFHFGQDHWGYFNGANNTNLLPAEPHNGFETGADRETNFSKSKACIITKMTYPTGGYIDFEYEQNSHYSAGGEHYYTQGSATLSSQPNTSVTTQFTIPQGSVLHKLTWTNDDDGLNTHNDDCIIRITGPNGFNRLFYNSSPVNGERNFLVTGTYTIEIETIGSSLGGGITASWLAQQTMPAGNRFTGGVRIKKVRNCTESHSCIETNYGYAKENGNSSGQNFYTPLYTYIASKTFLECIGQCFGSPYVTHYCDVYTQSSSSLTPLVNTQGSQVIYDEVTVSKTSATILGKTVFKFIVDKSVNSSLAYHPFPPVITYDWLNGTPSEITVYAYSGGEFTKVKKTLHKYIYSSIASRPDTLSNQTSVYGAKIGLQNYPHGCATNCAINTYAMPDIEFAVATYKLISSWHYLNETTEIHYTNDGQDSLVSTTQFFYDNPEHIQLTRTRTFTSKGIPQTSTNKYPLDYPHGINPAIDRLQDKHIVAQIIEQRREMESESNRLIDSKLFVYKNVDATSVLDRVKAFNPTVPIPSNTFMFYTGTAQDSQYEDEVIIEMYDPYKNPVQYRDRSGITGAYLWDYNFSLVIATATNTAHDQMAYTSFESTSNGNWNINGTARITAPSVTGDRHYSLAEGAINKSGLNPNTKYLISFWVKPGSAISLICNQIVSSTTTQESSDWELKRYLITGSTSVQIQGDGYIDELRLHPQDALMTTYAHKPGAGISASNDPNNSLRYFEYDNNGRLTQIKDSDKNIQQIFQYHYQNDVE